MCRSLPFFSQPVWSRKNRVFAECARTRVFCGRREGEGSGDDKEEREGGGREGDRGREGGTDTERDGEKETEREGGGERGRRSTTEQSVVLSKTFCE